MLSIRTKLKLVSLIQNYTAAELDRLILVFGIIVPIEANGNVPSKPKKVNAVLRILKDNAKNVGPLGKTIEEDVLQYFVDDFYDKHPQSEEPVDFFLGEPVEQYFLFCKPDILIHPFR